MKNKLYYVLLSLVVSFSFINSVFAEDEFTFSMKASNDDVVVAEGQEFGFSVSLQSTSDISQCSFNLDADDGIELVSKNGSNNWNFSDSSSNSVIKNNSSSTTDLSSGKNIFVLTYKINNDGKVTISNIECTSKVTSEDETEKTYEHEDIVIDFVVEGESVPAALSSLLVSGGQLSPSFSSDVFNYTVKLNSPNFSLSMTANDSEYQDKIVVTDEDGNTLDPDDITFSNVSGKGLMKLIITVNDESAYNLVVNYEEEKLDNSLATLKINGKEIALEDGKLEYDYEVSEDVLELNVEATLSDSENFQFKSGNEPGIYKVNSFVLIVEPKNSDAGAKQATYMINVIKESDKNTSTTKPSDTNKPSSTDKDGNATNNPGTGDVSMFVMAFILMASLFGSVILYRKNLESYR